MIIKIFKTGTGGGDGPVNYVTATIAPVYDPVTKRSILGCFVDRVPAPVIMAGNPERTKGLIDCSKNKWRYTSGVIAFADSDSPSDLEQREVMFDFERLLFAGFEREQYDVLWVRHGHEGNIELHFVIPRLELTTGKAFNPCPPGHQRAHDAFRNKWNHGKGWADPDDPARARIVKLDDHVVKANVARLKLGLRKVGDPKTEITNWLFQRIQIGLVKNRDDIVTSLREIGTITRQGDKYVSVKPRGYTRAIRLKGAIYVRDFRVDKMFAATIGDGSQTNRDPDPYRAKKAGKKLEKIIHRRAQYNIGRYCRPVNPKLQKKNKTPICNPKATQQRGGIIAKNDPKSLGQVADTDGDHLTQHLRWQLGPDALDLSESGATHFRFGQQNKDVYFGPYTIKARAAELGNQSGGNQPGVLRRFASKYQSLGWLDGWWQACCEIIKKLGSKTHDGIGAIISRRIGRTVKSVREGHSSTQKTSDILVNSCADTQQASRQLGRCLQQSDQLVVGRVTARLFFLSQQQINKTSKYSPKPQP